MKIKDFYDKIPSTNKNIFSSINSNLLGNKWTTSGLVQTSELLPLNNNLWTSILDRDVSIQVLNYCTFLNIDIDNLTSGQFIALLSALFINYKDKWLKLFDNVFAQTYNPIWNYDGSDFTVRTYEYGKTSTDTKDFSIEHSRDSTDTTTVTDNITDRDIYSFDGSTPVGSSKDTNNGESETAYSGSDTDTHSGTDTVAESGVDTERISTTKGGNQGTTTTQHMLEEEISIREKFMYFDIVSKDIIEVLTMGIYN